MGKRARQLGAYASHLDHACSAADGQSIDDRPCEAYGRLHTLDELYEYYVSLDVAISKIRSGLLLGRSSFLKETRDRNKTEQAMQSLFPMMFQIILVTATPFANVFTETGKGRVTQLPIRPMTNADDSLAYWGINQRVAEERRPTHRDVEVQDESPVGAQHGNPGELPVGVIEMVEDML